MCVIISRPPGITLDYTKIESACHVNSDGYGLSILDRGRLETIHEYNPRGNDPTDVFKRLEDAKDHQIWLHLRFSTAGSKGLANCHPFQVTTRSEDGFDSFFMHNGTMSDFRDKDNIRCDSSIFTEQVVSPLVRLFKAKSGQAQIPYDDSLFRNILTQYRGVYCIYDDQGHEVRIDPASLGKTFEVSEGLSWWASNSYSFNRSHRDYTSGWVKEPVKSSNSNVATLPTTKAGVVPFVEATVQDRSSVSAGSSESPLSVQCAAIGTAANALKGRTNRKVEHTPPSKRFTFCELSGLDSLESTTQFTEEDIEDLVNDAPEAATLLILDLLHALYAKATADRIETQARKVN